MQVRSTDNSILELDRTTVSEVSRPYERTLAWQDHQDEQGDSSYSDNCLIRNLPEN
ncbi:hypothetical protein PIIN_05924 [Serendipita indica DSM 11827]|uniref:Uncharacterized protein n=1 Tax=Serendipita indica (strain DSM 11827) TaxID=1109443 RepID=G4TKZ6_SERID|nr:hypothetical protein PIIN_05924 [Serendipita indica DSM 11827]